jgi:competence protein ComEC
MSVTQWLWLSLTLAAVTGVVFSLSWLSLVIALIVLGLTWQRLTHHWQRFGLIFIILISGSWWGSIDGHLTRSAQQPIQQATVEGIIWPDTIQIDGNQLHARAQLVSPVKQTVLVYATLSDEATKQAWQQVTTVQKLTTTGQLQPLLPATNIGQFDRQAYYQAKHITRQLTVDHLTPQAANPKHVGEQFIWQMRNWHAQALRAFEKLPQPLQAYATALLLGETSVDLYEINPAVQTLSLIHLFSVSGFQISYLIMFVTVLGKRAPWTREASAVMGLVVIWLYFFFTGMHDILLRAVLAGTLQLLAVLASVKGDARLFWSWSLIGSLCIWPQILMTLGGQLSFLLTFALLFTQHLSFWQRNLYLSLASLPLIVGQQSVWHVLATPTNFAAIPVFGYLIVPTVFIGVIGQNMPCILAVTNGIIGAFAQFLEILAQLPGKIIFGQFSPFIIAVLTICCVLAFIPEKRPRRYARLVGVVTLCWHVMSIQLPGEGVWRTFDIGQGDATVIQTPRNQSVVLIDTGGDIHFDQASWATRKHRTNKAETIIMPYLFSQGIGRLDYLVLTHKDFDHMGNTKYLLQALRVHHLVIPDGMQDTAIYKSDIAPYIRQHTRVILATADTVIPGFPLQILHPFKAGAAENEDSLVLYAKLGAQRIVLTGDLDQAGERAIAQRYPELQVDALKLGHHGSHTSTAADIMAKWQVHTGIVSAGRNSRYGHPHEETLLTAAQQQMRLFQTPEQGMITYRFWQNDGEWSTYRTKEELAKFTTTAP